MFEIPGGGGYQTWFRCLKPVGAKSRHDNFDHFDAWGMFEASPGVSRCMFEAALELVVCVTFEAGGMFEAARHGSHQTSRHVWNHKNSILSPSNKFHQSSNNINIKYTIKNKRNFYAKIHKNNISSIKMSKFAGFKEIRQYRKFTLFQKKYWYQ